MLRKIIVHPLKNASPRPEALIADRTDLVQKRHHSFLVWICPRPMFGTGKFICLNLFDFNHF